MHAHGKPLFGGMTCLPSAVTPSISNNLDLFSKAVNGVCYEHDVLVPRHQVALASGASDDQAVHAMLDLVGDKFVERVQIELAVGEVRGLDGCRGGLGR